MTLILYQPDSKEFMTSMQNCYPYFHINGWLHVGQMSRITLQTQSFCYSQSIFVCHIRPKHFRLLWFMPSLGVHSPWLDINFFPENEQFSSISALSKSKSFGGYITSLLVKHWNFMLSATATLTSVNLNHSTTKLTLGQWCLNDQWMNSMHFIMLDKGLSVKHDEKIIPEKNRLTMNEV